MRSFSKIAIIVLLPLLIIVGCSTTAPTREIIKEQPFEFTPSVSSEADRTIESPLIQSTDTPPDQPISNDSIAEPTQVKMENDGGLSDIVVTDSMASVVTTEPTISSDRAPGAEPLLFHYEFTDARTGKPFKISDFMGKVVLVETLAKWCSNCLRQQMEVYELHRILPDREKFVSIGIDIDPNEDLDMLKQYVKTNGFNWLYGVASADVSREIGNLLGDQYLNPPATPMFVIDQEGSIHELRFGIKNADELLEELDKYLP